VCLSVAFLTFLGLSSAWWWHTRASSALGMLICSTVGLLLVPSRAMGQIPSRLCSLPELFAFPSHQICASDFFSHPCRSSSRNSIFVFSSTIRRESLTNPWNQWLHCTMPPCMATARRAQW
jgi:hypothetical protein